MSPPSGLCGLSTVRGKSRASGRTRRPSWSAPGRATTDTPRTAPASTDASSSTNMRMTTRSLSTAARTVWCSTTAMKFVCGRRKPLPVMDHPKYSPYQEMNMSVPVKDSLSTLRTAGGSTPAGITRATAHSPTMSSGVPSDWPSTREA